MVKDAKRADTGPYNVVLKNASGSAEATVKVTVLGEFGEILLAFRRRLTGRKTNKQYSTECKPLFLYSPARPHL